MQGKELFEGMLLLGRVGMRLVCPTTYNSAIDELAVHHTQETTTLDLEAHSSVPVVLSGG